MPVTFYVDRMFLFEINIVITNTIKNSNLDYVNISLTLLCIYVYVYIYIYIYTQTHTIVSFLLVKFFIIQ